MQGDPYQVAIGFCDGQVMLHDHPTAFDATQDYSEALEVAFEPSEDPNVPERRHVRQVTLIKFNEKGEITRHIDSGVMNDDCSHRSVSTS